MAGGKRKYTDWAVIRARYLAGDTAQALADEFGIPVGTIKSKASREKWGEQRGEVASLVQPRLQERLADALAEQAVSAAVMSREEVLAELSRIARGGMHKVASWGAEGVVLRESEQLGDDVRIVAEVSETKGAMGGGSLKLKLFDKLSALDKLARYHGLYGTEKGGEKDGQPGIDASQPAPAADELAGLDPAELERLYREALG